MSREDTRRRRQAVETIHDVVSAMRAIAAGRIQGAQRALAAARRYEAVLARGVLALPAALLRLPEPQPGSRTSLIVMMSEQPLCGAFNQELLPLVERRHAELAEAGPVELLAVGQRGARLLMSRGIVPVDVIPAATSLAGLRDLVKRVAARIAGDYARGRLGSVRVLFNCHKSISERLPAEVRVLPPDLGALRTGAQSSDRRFLRYLSDATLLAGFVSELAFISLYRIAADSFACEQAARLVAMDGATHNTDRLLRELADLEQRERQGEITAQVLELISARVVAR